MTSLIPIIVALGAVIAAYTFFNDPLKSVPGPFLARFTRLWMVYHSRKGDMHTTMIDLHNKHGKLVRTAPNEVSISDLAAIKTIYGAGSKFRKSDWYSVWQGHRKFDLFGERDEKVHGKQRRLVSNVYSLDQLKKMETYIDRTLKLFLERLGDDDKPEEYNENGVLSMASSNIFAGSDTTGISITAVLYYLCKNPKCKEKLFREIQEKLRENNLDETENVPFKAGFSMTYLQACIYEALRMHPAVGMSLPRVVPPDGFETNGTFLPAGTIIGANAWVIHRNKEVFGSDCDVFRPERWLDGDRSQMDRFFFSFGAGARTCIGKNLSLIEITKLVPSLLLRYDIELANPNETPKQNCWWFVKQEGIGMKFKPRESRVDSPTAA